MAKLTGRTGSGKGLALRGKLQITVKRGQLIAAGWPRKRGKPKSAKTREQNEWFRQANLLAKYADGDAQWMAIEITKNGPLYPRDIMMSAMKGRLFEVLIIDGQEFTAVAVRDDVSHDLDLLAGTALGTLMFRGPELWQSLVPGTLGQVITSNGPTALPTYQPPGGAAAASYFQTGSLGSTSGSANATKGVPFKAALAFTIFGIAARVDAVSGETYVGRVLERNATRKILAISGSSSPITITVTGEQFIWAAFAVPVAIVAGSIYCLAFSRTDGGDTDVNPMFFAPTTEGVVGLPSVPFGVNADADVVSVLAKAVPLVDDIMTDTGAFELFLGMALTV